MHINVAICTSCCNLQRVYQQSRYMKMIKFTPPMAARRCNVTNSICVNSERTRFKGQTENSGVYLSSHRPYCVIHKLFYQSPYIAHPLKFMTKFQHKMHTCILKIYETCIPWSQFALNTCCVIQFEHLCKYVVCAFKMIGQSIA